MDWTVIFFHFTIFLWNPVSVWSSQWLGITCGWKMVSKISARNVNWLLTSLRVPSLCQVWETDYVSTIMLWENESQGFCWHIRAWRQWWCLRWSLNTMYAQGMMHSCGLNFKCWSVIIYSSVYSFVWFLLLLKNINKIWTFTKSSPWLQ